MNENEKQQGELPPLPMPKHMDEQCIHPSAYTADQMRDYARAAIAASQQAKE